MELFSDWMGMTGGGQAVGRYAHYLGGITWIGLLYYFNFIQGSAFAEMGDAARGEALRKITWRTLWWFRWAAALTWVSGIWILFHQEVLDSGDYWRSASGMGIAFGFVLGTTMAANVWMVIWVNTLFSIPLIFFMMFPSHFGMNFGNPDSGTRLTIWIVFLAIWAVTELSALGKIGGYDNAVNKVLLDKHKSTIIGGFEITVVLYLLFEILA